VFLNKSYFSFFVKATYPTHYSVSVAVVNAAVVGLAPAQLGFVLIPMRHITFFYEGVKRNVSFPEE
jgi:hypothetical protein